MQLVSATPIDRPFCVDALGERDDGVEVVALLGRGADDLLQQHRDADAAATGRPRRVLDGDVVVARPPTVTGIALGLGQLGGHLEVQHVAGVVLHDVQHAGAAVDDLGRLEHLVGRGRGEHLAGARGVQHPEPDEPAVQRLVTRPAAGDQRDLARPCGRAAVDDAVGSRPGARGGPRRPP